MRTRFFVGAVLALVLALATLSFAGSASKAEPVGTAEPSQAATTVARAQVRTADSCCPPSPSPPRSPPPSPAP